MNRSRSDLVVEFAGERFEVAERLTFGRSGDVALDTNRHLHRLVGEFEWRDGVWWITNLGTRLYLNVTAEDGSRSELAPGASQVLAGERGTVRIVVGTARYQLEYEVPRRTARRDLPLPPNDGRTVEFDAILTPREVDFLVTFARPIMEGEQGQLPTYAEVAELWGVAPKTLDNTVQAVKRKLRNARLAGDEPLDALVRIAVSHSLIGPADLEWAAFDDGPPRAAAIGPRFRPSTGSADGAGGGL